MHAIMNINITSRENNCIFCLFLAYPLLRESRLFNFHFLPFFFTQYYWIIKSRHAFKIKWHRYTFDWSNLFQPRHWPLRSNHSSPRIQLPAGHSPPAQHTTLSGLTPWPAAPRTERDARTPPHLALNTATSTLCWTGNLWKGWKIKSKKSLHHNLFYFFLYVQLCLTHWKRGHSIPYESRF